MVVIRNLVPHNRTHFPLLGSDTDGIPELVRSVLFSEASAHPGSSGLPIISVSNLVSRKKADATNRFLLAWRLRWYEVHGSACFSQFCRPRRFAPRHRPI